MDFTGTIAAAVPQTNINIESSNSSSNDNKHTYTVLKDIIDPSELKFDYNSNMTCKYLPIDYSLLPEFYIAYNLDAGMYRRSVCMYASLSVCLSLTITACLSVIIAFTVLYLHIDLSSI